MDGERRCGAWKRVRDGWDCNMETAVDQAVFLSKGQACYGVQPVSLSRVELITSNQFVWLVCEHEKSELCYGFQ